MSDQSNVKFDIYFGPKHGRNQYWRDIWEYRGLLYFLAWRDILVRYKQTIIGVAWSLLNPLFFMVVFTVIFQRVGRFPSEGVTPYPILVFAALLPWQLFSSALTQCSKSLVENRHMVSKIYFPRVIVPLSAVVVSLVDFCISVSLLVVMMLIYRWSPGWQIVFLPFFLLLAILAALSIGIWLSAINVKYRDFQYITPFMVQIGLFISPVGFTSSVIPEQWRLAYSLNPMVGVIDGFRWCLLGGEADIYFPGLILAVVLTLATLWFGVKYFRKTEQTFADFI